MFYTPSVETFREVAAQCVGAKGDIRDNIHPDRQVKTLVPGPNGRGMRVMVLSGKDMAPLKETGSNDKPGKS